MSDDPTRRCFIAVPLRPYAAEEWAAFAHALGLPGLRTVSSENLHLTIRFLGEVRASRLPELMDRMTGVGAGIGPFEMRVARWAVLPDPRRPRLLAALLRRSEPLIALHGRVDRTMASCGFQPDRRAFRPHVTLGRFRRRRGGRSASSVLPPSNPPRTPEAAGPAERLVLMRSDLRPAGPIHTVLGEYPLVPPE